LSELNLLEQPSKAQLFAVSGKPRPCTTLGWRSWTMQF